MVRLIWTTLLGLTFSFDTPAWCSDDEDDFARYISWKKERISAPERALKPHAQGSKNSKYIECLLLTPSDLLLYKQISLIAHLSAHPPAAPLQGFSGTQPDIIGKVFLYLDHYQDMFNLSVVAKKFNAAFARMPALVEGARAAFQKDFRDFIWSALPPHIQFECDVM